MNKLIRMKDVKTITALSPATIYRQMAMGKFPKAVKLTEKTIPSAKVPGGRIIYRKSDLQKLNEHFFNAPDIIL